jgi:membrane fusion protein
MSIFRKNVLHKKKQSFHGNVNISLPISWHIISYFFFGILVSIIIFLYFFQFSKIETVEGLLVPEKGLVTIQSSRVGVVESIEVNEGQAVSAGQGLMRIANNEFLLGGRSASSLVLDNLNFQDVEIFKQQKQITDASAAERRALMERVSGIESEISGLDDQIALQKKLVERAKADLDRATEIATRGFVSRRDIETREAAYITREQQLTQLKQSRSRLKAEIGQALQSTKRIEADSSRQVSLLESQKFDLAQRQANIRAAEATQLEAPIGGIITALTARKGQAVNPQQQLMMIVPDKSDLIGELSVASSSIGFLKENQHVSLALDAYPYQQFGTISAKITAISSAPISRANAEGRDIAVYIVTVRLQSNLIRVYGKQRRLKPGMKISARISTQKQSIFEWLFEPIFSLKNR